MAKHAKHNRAATRMSRCGGDAQLRMVAGAVEGAKRNLEGHASVFDSLSLPMWGQREIIRAGAFAKTLADGADVRALFNHDPNFVLGRRTAGTLELKETDKGLHSVIDQPDTALVRDLVVVPVERGDIREMSFGFRTIKEGVVLIDGEPVSEIIEAQLLDVSVVTFPAYEATDVEVRRLLQSTRGLDAAVLTRVLVAEGLNPKQVREWYNLAAAAVQDEHSGGPWVCSNEDMLRRVRMAELEG
jgi:HK97 family phage prohead protease